MVQFTEPEASSQRNEATFDSPPETAVNTAAPSRVPSIYESDKDAIYRSLSKIPQEKDTDLEAAQPPTQPSCIDPTTHVVSWDSPTDPANPMNFSRSKKWTITMVTALITFCVSFSSSVFSTATTATALEFDVSMEVMILGVSLYVLGFACGPLVWGPLSEVYGRTRPLFIGFALFTIFQIPVAVAQNLETIFLSRFLAGCFGAAPIAIVGGTYVDFWDTLDRGLATAGFAGATFLGPVAGPIIGEFITKSSLGWRWTAWITLIPSAFIGIVGLFTVPETYAPILLKRKAEKLRHETKNWAVHAPIDEQPIHLRSLFEKYFSKPWIMLFHEPILLAMTIHSSLVYSILYLIFFAYPYAFQFIRRWETGISALPFLGILLGILLTCLYIVLDGRLRFQHVLARSGKIVVPEARLPPMIVGSVMLPVALFWFAWTSSPSISWVPQVISGVLIGMGIMLVFLPSQMYIIDVYLLNANSALAASSCVRALMAAGFPLFATYMYKHLGVDWATSLLGFVCVGMVPFPVLFWVYGEGLRKRGQFAFVL